MKKPFIGCFNKSVILTYIGISSAIMGIINILSCNEFESVDRVSISMLLMIISGVCDLFDGVVARKCDRNEIQKQFGVQIDSLSDTICFGVFPIIIFIKLVGNSAISLLASLFYIIAVITRLAWFNIHHENKSFIGVPVTYIALVYPVLYKILAMLSLNGIYVCVSYIIILIMGLLYILNIKVSKPNKTAYVLLSLVAIVFIVLYLVV